MDALRNTARWAGIAVLAAFLASCNSSDSSDGPAGETASASIGPAGGTVAFADGRLTLVVPPGALASATQITITDVPAAGVPENLKPVAAQKVYRLEPAGTQFAVPARVTAKLAASATGELAVLLLESNGVIEAPANLAIEIAAEGRELSGDISHFSHVAVSKTDIVAATIAGLPEPVGVGEDVRITALLDVNVEDLRNFPVGYKGISLSLRGGFEVTERDDGELTQEFVVNPGSVKRATGHVIATCVAPGLGNAEYKFELETFVKFTYLDLPVLMQASVTVATSVTCTGTVPDTFTLILGFYDLLTFSAPDGVSVVYGAFAGLPGPGPSLVVAGANGYKVLDMVTGETVLDRTATGPDGASQGAPLLGVIPIAAPAASAPTPLHHTRVLNSRPVAQAAVAGAPAAWFAFGTAGSAMQNWSAANGYGLVNTVAGTVFDAATAGGTVQSDALISVSAARGVNFVFFDAASQAFRADPSKVLLPFEFPNAGQLVSAQLHASDGPVLALSREAFGTLGSKVFVHRRNGSPALALLSFSDPQARRLRCLLDAGKQRCLATLFGGEVKLFSFDPAAPTLIPTVTSVTTAAGSLGVDIAKRPNGNLVFVVANFTANSVNVIDTTSDLATVVGNTSVAAPPSCVNPAHPAFVTDSEGLKTVVTCNGSDGYWVLKP